MKLDLIKNVLDDTIGNINNIGPGVDKTHLGIETDILGQMAGGNRGLGPVGMSDSKNPLKSIDHDLLVKLGALGQKSLTAKVVDGKHLRTALTSAGDNTRGLKLGKTMIGKILTKGGDNSGLDTEDIENLLVLERSGAVIEKD